MLEDKMENDLKINDGTPLYILWKLTDDFEKVFCKVENNVFSLIGAKNHLFIKITFKFGGGFFKKNYNNKHLYIFTREEIKNNLRWFKNKSNSNKVENLRFIFENQSISIESTQVDTNLNSELEKPPMPNIPEIDDDGSCLIIDSKNIIEQLKPINEEIVKLEYVDNQLTMSNLNGDPLYKVESRMKGEIEEPVKTYCYKGPLLISFRFADIIDNSFNFYLQKKGANKISVESKGHPVIRGEFLLTGVSQRHLND